MLNEEANASGIELAVLIVYLDVTFGYLIGQEDILCKYRAHRACALVNASPSLDMASFGLCIYDHVHWLLTDDQNLLVFHGIILIFAHQFCLDIVLDFGLGLVLMLLVLEV